MADKKHKTKRPVTVPMIPQMEALECGAASLCMILAYYGRWVPLDRMRRDCGVSRDGSNAAKVASAAGEYGLTSKAKAYGPKLIREYGKFPCIIWWNYNHFVVLTGFKNGKACLNDPAQGRVTVSEEEFNSSYSNLCIEFVPNENFEKGGKRKSTISYLVDKVKGNRIELFLIMLMSSLTVLIGVVIPVFSRVYSDRILSGKNSDWIGSMLVIFFFVIIFQLLCGIVNKYLITRLTGKMAVVSNTSFLNHVLHMPMDFFGQRMAGDITSRQVSNDKVAQILAGQFGPLVIQIVLLVLYLAVMLQYSVSLSAIGVFTVLFNAFITKIISDKRTEISRIQMRDDSNLVSITMSGIDMIETIKAAGAENGFFEKWSGFQASSNKSKVSFERVNQVLGPLPAMIQQISSSAILVLGAYHIVKGNITAGVFLAFQVMLTAFLNPVNQLLAAGQQIQEMRSSLERIDDVMIYPEDQQFSNQASNLSELALADKLSGNIDIDHISFGYSKLSDPLIKDFTLKIKPGQKIAFVGGSGSGKSTIAKLISGLYEPWEGTITFDGKQRKDIPREVFTGSLSVVDQDIVLFEDSIENNIRMWDSTIENYDIILAAKDADIFDDIMSHARGFRHELKEDGRNLSGGQRQRLEIARVLSGDPSIIIMDEATSALDAKTEYQVSEAVRARGITTIIVAHRLSTIRDCDQILVFDHGVVKERGTHEELIALNGLYKELVTTE